jgi:hypothetical protein
MHHQVTAVGWPTLVLAAVLLIAALPVLVKWARFEFRLSRRASRIRAHEARKGWPYW